MKLNCPNCGEVFELDQTKSDELMAQIRDAAFDRKVREAVAKSEAELQARFSAQAELESERLKNRYESESADLKARLAAAEEKAAGARGQAQAEMALAIEKERAACKEQVASLRSELSSTQAKAELEMLHLKEDAALRERQLLEQVEFYRDMKARMSTKMVGETLERHCAAEFERIRAFLPEGVYFEKDNDARTGSKGDFIYREQKDGIEVLSVMFEMKNEVESTEKKHRNEDFFRELDKDRNEKGCEYAVLVSMLEADSDVYNAGIVDVSHRYPKMYVIRPQFFLPLLTILRSAGLSAMEARRELRTAREQSADIVRFDADLADFKKGFDYSCEQADKRLMETEDMLESLIRKLQEAKDKVSQARKHMDRATSKLDSLTLRKLCGNNQTMKQLLRDAGIEV